VADAPLVSVLTPVWNCERFVGQAVRSVWSQTHRPLELLAVDDGSTDRSYEVLQELARESPVPMKIWSPGHHGIAGALNFALEHAGGDFVTLLHADDVLLPEKIARQVAALEAQPDALLAHCEYLGIDEAGNPTGYDSDLDLPPARGRALRDLLLLRADVRSMTVMFRRCFFDTVGGYAEAYPVEDWVSILRACRLAPVVHVPQALVERRVHGENVSQVAHRAPRITPAEFGYPALGEVLPADMDPGRIRALHAGVVVRAAAAQGAWRKAASGFPVLRGLFPGQEWRLALPFFLGALSFARARILRPLLPASLIRRMLRIKARRGRHPESAGRGGGSAA